MKWTSSLMESLDHAEVHLLLAQGQGWRPRAPGCDSAGAVQRSFPTSRPGAATERSYHTAGVRGLAQEELPHARGQGRRLRGATPPPRSSCCTGAGRQRGATPCSRSGGEAMRRYPSSKVRSSGCALLEQPWRDTPRPRQEKPKWDGRCCKRASEGRHFSQQPWSSGVVVVRWSVSNHWVNWNWTTSKLLFLSLRRTNSEVDVLHSSMQIYMETWITFIFRKFNLWKLILEEEGSLNRMILME